MTGAPAGVVRRAQGGGEAGTATLEMVILAPFLLLLLMMVISFARYAQTESLVDQAARDAARAATAQNSRESVDATVSSVLQQVMAEAPPSCARSAKAVPTLQGKAFEAPNPDAPLEIATVSVAVTCILDLSDVAPVPAIASLRLRRSFTSPLDRYRGYR